MSIAIQRLSREARSPVTTGLILGVLALAGFGLVRGGAFILVDSLVTGAIWALVAAGLALTFGVMGVPNFAQGEFFMVGTLSGYLAYTAMHGTGGQVWVPFATILLAASVGFLLGALTDLAIFSQMRRRTREGWVMNTFVVTVGLSVVMINAHQLIWGTDYKGIVAYFNGPALSVLGVSIALDRIFSISVAAVAMASLWWLLSYSRVGRAIRAVSQDEPGALMVGINVGRMRTLTFAISSALAALAGATLLFMFPSFPFVGVKPLYVAWTVVILAGLGNVGGAVVAGFIIALLESTTGFFIGSAWGDVVPFALIVLILAIRPTGLFGRAVRTVWEQ